MIMKDVVGLSTEKAYELLRDQNYNVERIYLKNSDDNKGKYRQIVIRQRMKDENTIELIIDLIKII